LDKEGKKTLMTKEEIMNLSQPIGTTFWFPRWNKILGNKFDPMDQNPNYKEEQNLD
jgi:hypothetical protein